MTRIAKILNKLEESELSLFEAKAGRVVSKFLSDFEKIRKERSKFLKDFDKKHYGGDMVQDPKKGDPGYGEWDKFFKKSDKDIKSLFKKMKDVVSDAEAVLASGEIPPAIQKKLRKERGLWRLDAKEAGVQKNELQQLHLLLSDIELGRTDSRKAQEQRKSDFVDKHSEKTFWDGKVIKDSDSPYSDDAREFTVIINDEELNSLFGAMFGGVIMNPKKMPKENVDRKNVKVQLAFFTKDALISEIRK